MSTAAQTHSVRSVPRAVFGAILFLGWGIMAILWVASTIDSAIDGDVTPVVSAVAAIALMCLLGGMEGLEVAVIDRWRTVFPDGLKSHLAAWLAARQFFVAMIVTAATLLAHRAYIVIPGTDTRLTDEFALRIYDMTFVTLTVLWFAQIFPKHLAATNPDRYLSKTRPLFPVVEFVRKVGVSQPGEWTAVAVENRLSWPAPAEEIEEAPARREDSLASIWRELIPESRPSLGEPTDG
jgi:hypothetical protein